jgi:methylated-DNA-protein-cysteine methyltransferase-like protein
MKGTFSLIYDIVRQIPYGCVSTYGQIALLAGNPRFSAVVGYALNGCPEDADVPTHRVVNRFGGLSDAFLPLGKETHRMLLEMEGVKFNNDSHVDLEMSMWYGPDQE